MPVNNKYIEDFAEEGYMHLICKSVGGALLFRTDENRKFFLAQYARYSSGYFETLSYILLNNHVHFLIKCNSGSCLRKHLMTLDEELLKSHQKKFLNEEITFSQALEFQCKDFFISYAMAYNKVFGRSGGLFVNPFRRIAIRDEEHLLQLIVYIHTNVLKHRTHKEYTTYKWSSYASILSEKPTELVREEVLYLFGGRDEFKQMHREYTAYYYHHSLSMED